MLGTPQEMIDEERNYLETLNKDNKYIACWWSGGVTSAIAVKHVIDIYGKDKCRVLFIDTGCEHEDTYRFKDDCEKWYGISIETATRIGTDYNSITDVWMKYKSLNVSTGAICSTELKRKVREKYQEENPDFIYNVFGYDLDESKRAKGMTKNNPNVKAIYPLMMFGEFKQDCFDILNSVGIVPPLAYQLGFHNNNCLGNSESDEGGCVQGGIGYWQKMKNVFPKKYYTRAKLEHILTDLKGYPVTMLKDQSNEAKDKIKKDSKTKDHLVFLEPHPNYPQNKSLADMPLMKVEPLIDCNGYCGTRDLDVKAIEFQKQINFETDN